MIQKIICSIGWAVVFFFGTAIILGAFTAFFAMAFVTSGHEFQDESMLINAFGASWAFGPMILGPIGLLLGLAGKLPGTKLRRRVSQESGVPPPSPSTGDSAPLPIAPQLGNIYSEGKMSKFSETLRAVQWAIIATLLFYGFIKWGEIEILQHDLDGLTLREIILDVTDESGKHLPQSSIRIEPKYSFDEIKPKSQITMLGTGRARLAVSFSRSFDIHISAHGYGSKKVEYKERDPTELSVVLSPLAQVEEKEDGNGK